MIQARGRGAGSVSRTQDPAGLSFLNGVSAGGSREVCSQIRRVSSSHFHVVLT